MTHGEHGIINLQQVANGVTDGLKTRRFLEMEGEIKEADPNRTNREIFSKGVEGRIPRLNTERVIPQLYSLPKIKS